MLDLEPDCVERRTFHELVAGSSWGPEEPKPEKEQRRSKETGVSSTAASTAHAFQADALDDAVHQRDHEKQSSRTERQVQVAERILLVRGYIVQKRQEGLGSSLLRSYAKARLSPLSPGSKARYDARRTEGPEARFFSRGRQAAALRLFAFFAFLRKSTPFAFELLAQRRVMMREGPKVLKPV